MSSAADPSDPPAPAATPSAGLSTGQLLRSVCGLLAASFVAVLPAAVLPTAAPRIAADLGAGPTAAVWVVSVPLLTLALTVPAWAATAGTLTRAGRAAVPVALVLLLAGSVGAAASPGLGSLLAAEAVLGAGAGGVAALVPGVLGALLPPQHAARYARLFGAVLAAAGLAGPVLGGLLTGSTPAASAAAGWRWTFLLGVPLAVVALVLLRGAPSPAAAPRHRDRPAVTDLALAATVGLVGVGAAVFGSLTAQLALGGAPLGAGVLGLVLALGLLSSSAVAGALVSAGRAGVVGGFGAATMAAALLLLAGTGGGGSLPVLGLGLALVGLGVGLGAQALAGSAAPAVELVRGLVGAAGIGVLGLVLAPRVDRSPGEPFAVMAAVAVLALALQLTRRTSQRVPKPLRPPRRGGEPHGAPA